MIYIGYIGLTWGEGGFWSWYVGYLRYIGGGGGVVGGGWEVNLGIENKNKKKKKSAKLCFKISVF